MVYDRETDESHIDLRVAQRSKVSKVLLQKPDKRYVKNERQQHSLQ